MNPAFNILPATSFNEPLHLLIEVGSYGMSFLWFKKEPVSVHGLVTYNFLHDSSVKQISEIFERHFSLPTNPSTVTICYDYKESILIPAKYHQADLSKEALALVHGEDVDNYFNHDLINSAGIYNHYRIDNNIQAIFANQFPSATIFHSTSLQFEQLNGENDLLYCIIFHNVMKVILIKEELPQFAQQFSYVSPEDVAYHLLNVCEQHRSGPSKLRLRLSGMIDEDSRLYAELYKYFLNIEFDKVPVNIYASTDIKQLPAHFFSHLTCLAICVL